MNNKVPCHNCEERVVGCHSTCSKYKEYNDNNEKYKKEIRKQTEVTGTLCGYNKNKKYQSKTNKFIRESRDKK